MVRQLWFDALQAGAGGRQEDIKGGICAGSTRESSTCNKYPILDSLTILRKTKAFQDDGQPANKAKPSATARPHHGAAVDHEAGPAKAPSEAGDRSLHADTSTSLKRFD